MEKDHVGYARGPQSPQVPPRGGRARKTVSAPVPAAVSREAIGHIYWCAGSCRDWRHHTFTLLPNDNLAKVCQKCGRSVEFVFRAETWLPIPIEQALGKYVDKRIREAEAKYAAKLRKRKEERERKELPPDKPA